MYGNRHPAEIYFFKVTYHYHPSLEAVGQAARRFNCYHTSFLFKFISFISFFHLFFLQWLLKYGIDFSCSTSALHKSSRSWEKSYGWADHGIRRRARFLKSWAASYTFITFTPFFMSVRIDVTFPTIFLIESLEPYLNRSQNTIRKMATQNSSHNSVTKLIASRGYPTEKLSFLLSFNQSDE